MARVTGGTGVGRGGGTDRWLPGRGKDGREIGYRARQLEVDTAWIRGLLRDMGVSQNELAARMGLDKASMSLLLRGYRDMGLVEADRLARELGVDLNELLHHVRPWAH